MSQHRYHQVSGGAGSWLAAKVDMERNPAAEHHFWFADTLYEDADCYRFLLEGVAFLVGRPWTPPAAGQFPDYRMLGDFDFATYAGNPEWRAFLADLRVQAAERLPELTWLVEGRDPWEVFRDSRFLGNSRVDPCSRSLKRAVLDTHRLANTNAAEAVFLLGIGPHERHRYDRLAERMAADGWRYEAPLLTGMEGEFGPFGYLSDAGIERPRLYRLGYMHNNCGGFCIKAGHGHYHNRLRVSPERFAYDAMMERKLSEYLGKTVTMLTDRTGDNVKKPLSLDAFADLASRQTSLFEYEPGTSGCGCVLDDYANDNDEAKEEAA